MTIRKVTKTRYADTTDRRGHWREAVWCELDCGHFVIRQYHSRRAFTTARCEWCAAEKRDGVKYVRRPRIGGADGPDFIPEAANT